MSVSTTAASSATRTPFSIGRVMIAVPSRIREVRAAAWERKTSGEGSPPSVAEKWCWATQAVAKPNRSAVSICSSANRYRRSAGASSRRRVKNPSRGPVVGVGLVIVSVIVDLSSLPRRGCRRRWGRRGWRS